ncbi:MAG: ParB/RepB/Spo0J family partition protein [Acidimicrobiia bacterium]
MTSRRGGLGRGLEALIPVGTTESSVFQNLPVDSIVPNPQQPRTRFDDEALAALAESIAEIGLLQPIVVRESDTGYVLVAGERRLRAAKRAGLTEIPAVIRAVDDDAGSLVQALVENVQREDLTPLEEAAAYQQMLDDFGMTHAAIAERVGKSRSAISNALRLLGLPAGIQVLVERGDLSAGHARALLGTDDRAYAEHVGRRAAEEGWSVRQVEDAIRSREKGQEAPNSPRVRELRPVEIIELEQRLTEQLGTKVAIDYRSKKGKVQISFASLDELERLYRRFFAV